MSIEDFFCLCIFAFILCLIKSIDSLIHLSQKHRKKYKRAKELDYLFVGYLGLYSLTINNNFFFFLNS